VHYADLLADPRGQIRRLADFLRLEADAPTIERIVEATSIDNMRSAMKAEGEERWEAFEGGADSFIYKGTNGRWRGVLGDEELRLYEEAKRRVLDPDCSSWLETGSLDPSTGASGTSTAR